MISTPITPATAALIAELIRLTDAIDRATHDKDWPAVRAFFADQVDADFSSLSGSPLRPSRPTTSSGAGART